MSCAVTCPSGTYADRTTDPNNLTCKVLFFDKILNLLLILKNSLV